LQPYNTIKIGRSNNKYKFYLYKQTSTKGISWDKSAVQNWGDKELLDLTGETISLEKGRGTWFALTTTGWILLKRTISTAV
jgi:hypothetical protein